MQSLLLYKKHCKIESGKMQHSTPCCIPKCIFIMSIIVFMEKKFSAKNHACHTVILSYCIRPIKYPGALPKKRGLIRMMEKKEKLS